MDELSLAEVKALDEAIAAYKDMDTKVLSELSHDEAWHAAWDANHNAMMSPISIARAGNASKEFLEYIKEQESINSFLGV